MRYLAIVLLMLLPVLLLAGTATDRSWPRFIRSGFLASDDSRTRYSSSKTAKSSTRTRGSQRLSTSLSATHQAVRSSSLSPR